jgi:hypothetical protein
VLFALGGAMIFWGFMRRISFWFIGLVSLAAVLVTQFVTPGPDHAATLGYHRFKGHKSLASLWRFF